MNRFPILLGTALALAGVAQAQTVSSTYTSVGPYGNLTTTTIQGQVGVTGGIANQGYYSGYGYGGYAGYGSYPNFNGPCLTPLNNGYKSPGYGYGNGYGYGTFGYVPGQVYYAPGYAVPVGQPGFGWCPSTTIIGGPQVVVTPSIIGYPGYGQGYLPQEPCPVPGRPGQYPYGAQPYYGYGAPAPYYGYGYGRRSEGAQGSFSIGGGGLNVSIGGSTTRSR